MVYSDYVNDEVGPATEYVKSAAYLLGDSFDECGCLADSKTEPSYGCHIPPSCLLKQLGQTGEAHSPQIGWVIDGFPLVRSAGSERPVHAVVQRHGRHDRRRRVSRRVQRLLRHDPRGQI